MELLIKKIRNKKRKGVSLIILIFSAMAIIAMLAMVIDLGLVLNCRYELQKVIDTAALAAVADYEAYEDGGNTIRYPTAAQISTNTNSLVNNNLNAFIATNSSMYLANSLVTSVYFGSTIQSRYSRAIRIDASVQVRTHLLPLVGINSIKINAKTAAMHLPFYMKNGSVLTGIGTYRDTDLRAPANGAATNVTINTITNAMPAMTNLNTSLANLYGYPDGNVISLGGGGYITLKPPVTLIDGRGFDLYIYTRGNAYGYFVFAGNDTDPNNPYIDAATPGSGISWANISCTGTPIDTYTNSRVGSYNQLVLGSTQAKFYGSGYFDLRANCSTGYNHNVKTAKYIKIIDDNIEDGFIIKDVEQSSSLTPVPSFFPGQHNSMTPGVSIDAIAIEHHPRLINVSEFVTDTDNDGLINIFETTLGLQPCGNSESAGNCTTPPASDDAIELWGAKNTNRNNIIIDNPTNGLRSNYPAKSQNPPMFFVNY